MAGIAPLVSDMSEDEDEDDPVVRELDVYVCNEFLGSATQLCLFQHPLRPPWRPYDYGKVKQIRLKTNARRIEIDVPLDTNSSNYNDIIEDFKKVNSVTLRSNLSEAKTSLALGTIQDGKLLLSPIDYAVQMRPTLPHLNVGNEKKKGGDDSSEEEEDEPVMKAVEVQVQKRETERQQQARLNSYAYISQKEEEEVWVPLALHSAESQAAEGVWQRFMAPKTDVEVPVNIDRPTYLKAVIPPPSSGNAPSGELGADAAAAAAAAAAANERESLAEEVMSALPAALKALFSKHSVCRMVDVRTWLQDPASQAGAAREAAFLTDRALHDAVMAHANVVCIRRMYVLKSTGNAATDPFRAVVLELLQEKESFKKSEVLELAASKGITNITETMYNKVVKDMCQTRAYLWLLKTGADLQ